MDGKHVVFGKVKEGMKIVEPMRALGLGMARPARSPLSTVGTMNENCGSCEGFGARNDKTS